MEKQKKQEEPKQDIYVYSILNECVAVNVEI